MSYDVMFDLDGTLMDHNSAAASAVIGLLSQSGVTDAILLENVGTEWLRLEKEYFPQYLSGRLSFEEQRHARMQNLRNWTHNSLHDDVDVLFRQYLQLYAANWKPFPEVRETLGRLAELGCQVGVLSNGQQAQQQDKLIKIGLQQLTPRLVTSEQIGAKKPASDAFTSACEALGMSPATTTYVGDDWDADVLGSQRAGLRPVWIDRAMSKVSDQEPGVAVIRSLADLLPLMRQT